MADRVIFRRRAVVWALLSTSFIPVASADEAIRLTTEPAAIRAAPGSFQQFVSFNSLGTEVSTLTIQNQSSRAIELPERRWLVVEGAAGSGQTVFTPKPPYTPLLVEPGRSLAVQWRLREATDVYLVDGQTQVPGVFAGAYRVLIYYRYSGDNAYRQLTFPLQIRADRIALGWAIVIVIVIIVVVVVGLFSED